jgi:glycosyltransferase involved in cell wall biosynthesis
MKIALLAPFEERVPPEKYGGTELIVSNVTEGLVERGHEVFLLATGDSQTKANLVSIFPRSIRKENMSNDMKLREALKYLGVGKAIDFLSKIDLDIVHNHIGWRILPFAGLLKCPTITTLHGPMDAQSFFYSTFKNQPFVSISNSQRKPLPDLNYVSTVYNGIDISKLEFSKKSQDYFAFLGRMSPEKGPVQAIQMAKLAGVKLKMAAKVDTVDANYFEKEVKPLIDGKQIEFIGEIGPKEKSDFLKNAKGLIAPIQWEEPFGLFFTEAMACGAPVIACNRGSVPEIVVNGKTGFIINTIEEGVEAVKNIGKINRSDCRKHVEENFTTEKMVDGYEKAYESLVK